MNNPARALRILEWSAAILLTAMVLLLHTTRLFHAGALWRDEVAALNLATRPVADIWDGLRFEIMPAFPLAVFRLWASTPLGRTDFGLRVLGCFVGVAIIAILWWDAVTLGHRFPFISLLLLGLNGPLVRWGDSLRGYGMGLLCFLSAYGLMWRAIQSPTTLSALLAAIASMLTVQCLYPNVPQFAAVCVAAVAVGVRRGSVRNTALVVGIGFAAIVSLVPYAGPLKRAQEWTMLVADPVTLFGIWWGFGNALGSTTIRLLWVVLLMLGLGSAAVLFLRKPIPAMDARVRGVLQTGARGALLTPSVGAARKRDLLLFCGSSTVIGLIGFVLMAEHSRYLSWWHYVPLMGNVAVSLDALFGSLARSTRAGYCRLLVVAGLAVSLWGSAWRNVHIRQTNVDLVARVLGKYTTGRDTIVVDPWYMAISFERYYRGNAPWISMPSMAGAGIHRYDLVKAEMMTANPSAAIVERIARTLREGRRVWVVGRLYFLPEGSVLPSLRPAPQEGTWREATYTWAWSLQAGYFIQSHAADVELVEVPAEDPVSPDETMILATASGWRADSTD